MMQPLVTVNILSYNRKDDLRITLTKVFEQDYKNIEVIVVDNNSTDGTREMVKQEFPDVHLIELEKNIGIAGWNEGFKAAKGEYVLVLDDDSYPANDAIALVVNRISENDQCAIIGMCIYNCQKKVFEYPIKLNGITISFTGCGALIRKDIIDKVGLFSEDLFLYQHEIEYSIRVYNAGYIIDEEKKAIAYHLLSTSNRLKNDKIKIDTRKLFYDNRNTIIILLTHFSSTKVFFRIFRITLGRIFLGFRERCFFISLKGIFEGFKVYFSSNPALNVNAGTQRLFRYGAFAGGFFFWNAVYEYGNRRPSWLKFINFIQL